MSDDLSENALLSALQITLEDIERAKRWQWVSSYSSAGAQFAIIGMFAALLEDVTETILRPILTSASALVFFMGFWATRNSASGISRFRQRNERIMTQLGSKFKHIFRGTPSGDPDRPDMIWPLDALVLGSFTVVIALLWAEPMLRWTCRS